MFAKFNILVVLFQYILLNDDIAAGKVSFSMKMNMEKLYPAERHTRTRKQNAEEAHKDFAKSFPYLSV